MEKNRLTQLPPQELNNLDGATCFQVHLSFCRTWILSIFCMLQNILSDGFGLYVYELMENMLLSPNPGYTIKGQKPKYLLLRRAQSHCGKWKTITSQTFRLKPVL